MEASNSRGRQGEGQEARRVNVVYFLSRSGRVEHPHLLRIRRLHRDRVRLRDVKRWLLEFRGNQVPDSFSWSYKRRYRGGYVWQDLRDDDLITPFSDNEYILKGSSDGILTLEKPATGTPPTSAMPLPEQDRERSSEPKRDGDGTQEDAKDKKAATRVARVLCDLLGCKTAEDASRPASHR